MTISYDAMDRRQMLGGLFGAVCAALLSRCGGTAATPVSDAGNDAATPGDGSADASSADVNNTDVSARDVSASDVSAGAWATGGTRVITGTYPNPFTAAATTCALVCQTTIGPCHTLSPERTDVSDGLDGLPVLLSLRILDETCAPVSNAIVEIWHTNHQGIYSGNISTMCNRDAADRAAMYFRGYQRTDAQGRVDFKTCFPGWYSSRAVHIHVRVMRGDYVATDSAAAAVITQLVFPDALIQSIFANEPLYSTHGQPDTLLARDNVVGSVTDRSPYLADVARAADGVMLASKTLVVRGVSSTSTLCTVGSMGGMMP
jgi:protocatechuate 3,4-dioxygenase beta subunit